MPSLPGNSSFARVGGVETPLPNPVGANPSSAAVIADRSIVDRIGQQSLDSLCTGLTSRLRTAAPIDALCGAITEAGEQLAGVLPRADDDVNELPDALITIG